MEFGLFLPQPNSPEAVEILGAVVQGADARGFATVWTGEHVVLFDDYTSSYPYGENGEWPFGSEAPWLEPLQLLTFLGARTSRIRLGSIVLVPQRNPVYTAKSVTTLDYLSGGRVNFGVGVGWSREEFEALEVPFEQRGARCREYIEVMKSLWSDETASHSGPLYELPACKQRPAPIQQPHPPIYFGGHSDAALTRLADLGDGWFGFGLTAEETTERVERLHELLQERKRDPADVHLAIASGGEVNNDVVQEYFAAGVNQFVLDCPLLATVDESLAALDQLAASYLSK